MLPASATLGSLQGGADIRGQVRACRNEQPGELSLIA
jgi:hypothetical protein